MSSPGTFRRAARRLLDVGCGRGRLVSRDQEPRRRSPRRRHRERPGRGRARTGSAGRGPRRRRAAGTRRPRTRAEVRCVSLRRRPRALEDPVRALLQARSLAEPGATRREASPTRAIFPCARPCPRPLRPGSRRAWPMQGHLRWFTKGSLGGRAGGSRLAGGLARVMAGSGRAWSAGFLAGLDRWPHSTPRVFGHTSGSPSRDPLPVALKSARRPPEEPLMSRRRTRNLARARARTSFCVSLDAPSVSRAAVRGHEPFPRNGSRRPANRPVPRACPFDRSSCRRVSDLTAPSEDLPRHLPRLPAAGQSAASISRRSSRRKATPSTSRLSGRTAAHNCSCATTSRRSEPLPPGSRAGREALLTLASCRARISVFLTRGHRDVARLTKARSSPASSTRAKRYLAAAGVDPDRCARVLDFGCGSGRITDRMAPGQPGERPLRLRHQPRLNRLGFRGIFPHSLRIWITPPALPPLPYPDGPVSDHGPCAFSVYSHTSGSRKPGLWVAELARGPDAGAFSC